ncbi:hypothetical protein F511_21762 [Dorcoceras hygrometricum]|uniref:CCHC-type domain-containing protein n=1 Tax=Dorcoceras hygrometricum TaxID=472368 RepID=A0A2Z7BK94_9LAMI|nr:hypothetical protein F511_21762 [Dorcoceras hygrometricum]
MHVAVKEHRSSRPANQLAVISIEPLYPHSVSTGEIIGMTHLSAGHNVALSQVLNRSMAQYVCINAMKFTSDFNMHKLHLTRHGNFGLLKIATSLVTSNTTGTSLELKSVKEISYLSSQLHFSSLIPTIKTHIWFYLAKQLLTARTKLKTARNTYPESHMHRRTLYSTVTKTHQLQASSRSLSNIDPGFLTGINRKIYSRRAQRHQSRSKQRQKSTVIYRRSVQTNSNYRGFTGENDEEYRVQNTLSVGQHLMLSRRGRGRTTRRTFEESRTPEIDEDVAQPMNLCVVVLERQSGSGGVMCGQCGGRHMTTQCREVQGLCRNYGHPGHFARVCQRGAQPSNKSQQGSAGGSSQ